MSDDIRKNEQTHIKPKGRFLSGVAILTFSTIIVKIIGLLYKIPMMRLLGEEGMGYFNSAYEIYTFFYILATAGLPVAISILVAENIEKGRASSARKIFWVAIVLFLVLGVVGTAALYFGAEIFAGFIENSGSVLCIAAISPMVLFVCISSAIRGYFQGCQDMTPTAVSQIIEAVGKLLLGLTFGAWAIKNGYDIAHAAAFSTLGMALGMGLSMLYLMLARILSRKKEGVPFSASVQAEKSGAIAKSIIKIAIPITFSSTIISLTRVVDLFMILRRLQSIGYTEEAANAVYGSYSTLAISMFNLPAAFVTPIALALVPILASAIGGGDRIKEANTLNSSLRLCGLITIPASLGLSVFSRPLLELVFSGEESAINTAAPLLSVLGMSVFFSCMMTVTNAILQAYGKERLPIISMVVGAVVKVVISYILIGIPEINIYGATISTLACSFVVSEMNFAYIRKCTNRIESPARLFGDCLWASMLSVAVGGGVYLLLITRVGASQLLTLASIGITVFAFALLGLKLGAIREDDLLMLPKGEKIYKILRKIKLAKK